MNLQTSSFAGGGMTPGMGTKISIVGMSPARPSYNFAGNGNASLGYAGNPRVGGPLGLLLLLAVFNGHKKAQKAQKTTKLGIRALNGLQRVAVLGCPDTRTAWQTRVLRSVKRVLKGVRLLSDQKTSFGWVTGGLVTGNCCFSDMEALA